MNDIRLLIIEEHTAVRDALQVRLQSSSNLDVIAAHKRVTDWDAQRPLLLSPDKANADVVLLGLKSSGYRPLSATINDIRSFERCGTAVIVLASVADDIERELVFQAGAQSYLLKDINSTQLIAEIKALAAARAH
ncbi:MAG: response regulator transcription factor [Chloroflexi bacterium]|nr:response regulator transcription factor [Chloroflexota bacterium]